MMSTFPRRRTVTIREEDQSARKRCDRFRGLTLRHRDESLATLEEDAAVRGVGRAERAADGEDEVERGEEDVVGHPQGSLGRPEPRFLVLHTERGHVQDREH